MRVRNGPLAATAAVAAFVVVAVAVTELLSPAVEFSLLVGLPAGLAGGALLGAVTYRWLGATDPGVRRRGAALAGFGAVFLAALVALVVVGGLRNSQALPIAAVAGAVGSAGTYLWLRRTERVASTADSSS